MSAISDSILTSVKLNLGIGEEHTSFDAEIITHINTTFQILHQLGAIQKDDFFIEDNVATWDDVLGSSKKLESIKTYVNKKVKMAFDPPTNSSHMEALNGIINELEFRLSVAGGTKEVDEDGSLN